VCAKKKHVLVENHVNINVVERSWNVF